VVGCDAYPNLPRGDLKGAVADALAFRGWLLTSGAVPPADLRFLASRTAGGAQPPTGVPVNGAADLPTFAAEVKELVTGPGGDRLYVYFAGHGCRTDPDNPYLAQDVLVLGEFDPNAPQAACVAVRDLTTQLAQGDFGEIVVVLDCCRNFPFAEPFQVGGFGRNWEGRRRSGAAAQFQLQATLPGEVAAGGPVGGPNGGPAAVRGHFTAALIDALNGSGSAKVFDDTDDSGYPYVVRWSSLEQYLRAAVPQQPPTTTGQNSSAVFARFRDGHFTDVTLAVEVNNPPGPVTLEARYPMPGEPDDGRAAATGAPPLSVKLPPRRSRIVAASGALRTARSLDVYTDTTVRITLAPPHETVIGQPGRIMRGGKTGDGRGGFEIVAADPHAMLTVEDASGSRTAVGVGSIEGTLPVGSYTAVLADPVGVDPRVAFDIAEGRVSEVTIAPTERSDGFRVSDDGPLRWSSPAAQLAAATTGLWAHGHRAYLLVGGGPGVPLPSRVIAGFPQRFEHSGRLDLPEIGWWVALPVRGPWRSIALAGHRITVPAAPDSVSAVAVTTETTTTALFDTTHPRPEEIAAQDRVQEYLAVGQLGAADLTSRLAAEAQGRWPWGATAAIRRLIDGTRSALAAADGPRHETSQRAGDRAGDAAESEDPPFPFVADVPPDQRHRLVGHGPWAVWLDWP